MTVYTANVPADQLEVGDVLRSGFTRGWGAITAIVPYQPARGAPARPGWRVAVFEGGQSMTLTPGSTLLPA